MYKQDIKFLAFLISAMFWGSGVLANELYMEQIGDNTSITVLQDGTSNVIKGTGVASDDKAKLSGDFITANITQQGISNKLNLYVDTSNAPLALTTTAIGNDNVQTISCGDASVGSCNASTITSNITGNNNNVTQSLNGGAASSIINVTASYNNVTHTATGAGAHTADITVTGSGTLGNPNVLSLIQSGISAKSAVITTNGTTNNIAVTQSD